LPLLDDVPTSPASRRLAAEPRGAANAAHPLRGSGPRGGLAQRARTRPRRGRFLFPL